MAWDAQIGWDGVGQVVSVYTYVYIYIHTSYTINMHKISNIYIRDVVWDGEDDCQTCFP
jgi:hypothetical protein